MRTPRVYLDNAATTPIAPPVLALMYNLMENHFGNPSSNHAHGRAVRAEIEKARKLIADCMEVTPGEIIFTSCGTEADNMAIRGAVSAYGLKQIISSPIEHHAVTHTIESLANQVYIHWLAVDEQGQISLAELEEQLKKEPKALVSLMHGNNEIGNLLDLEAVASLCKKYGALFHTDAVQTVGHYALNLSQIKVNYLAASAHKFHGPKGIGFIYIRKDSKIPPYITGGAQERNFRGGTENVYGIVGMAKALELCLQGLAEHQKHIQSLKNRMIAKLREVFGQDVKFNGLSASPESLYTVLNVSLPAGDSADMLLFNLDIEGVSASGGSACTSGAATGSHVLTAIGADLTRANIRFSFSRFNTEKDIDFAIRKLFEIYSRYVSYSLPLTNNNFC